jgi:hypothetical protein
MVTKSIRPIKLVSTIATDHIWAPTERTVVSLKVSCIHLHLEKLSP